MNNYAPILIPTLNRFKHFKCCVESLSKCTHADKTDLYIALDYPLKESHWEGYQRIEKYIEEIDGFKTVTVLKRNENYGAVKNYLDGNKVVFDKYDRVIFCEDDNEFSPNFLDYINKGLDKFENDNRVFAICGYNYPVVMPQDYIYNYYCVNAFSAWGYGIWKNRYEEFYLNFNYDYIQYKLRNIKDVFILFIKRPRSINSLLQIVKSGHLTADVVITSNLITKNIYCIFPALTKVRNYGHDGTGVNCGNIEGENIYLSQSIDINDSFIFDETHKTKDIKSINIIIDKYFYISFIFKVRIFLKYVLYRMTGYVFTR